MYYYQKQVRIQNVPAKLFDKPPTIYFKPDQQACPVCKRQLHVLKTTTRLIKMLGIGQFKAHHTFLCCPNHNGMAAWKSTELQKLVPQDANVAYNVIVEIGKLRFLKTDSYILHLDATCEADSPKLVSSIDSVSGFVLYSAKLKSENKDDMTTFLKEIKKSFGIPHAVLSDMSKGIKAAVESVFADIPHFICHFHFLTLQKIVERYEAKVSVFSKLRQAFGTTADSVNNGLTHMIQTTTVQEVEKIKESVEKCITNLKERITSVTDKQITDSYIKAIARIEKYGKHLFII